MAIYYAKVKTVSRKQMSSVAHAAYILREKRYAKAAAELQYAHSGNLPSWAKDQPLAFWKTLDDHERVNGRAYKDFVMALPKELTTDQQTELAHDYVEQISGGLALPYSLAIHDKGDGNPHLHLMLNERVNDGIERTPELWFRRANTKEPERGGAKKTTALKGQEWFERARAEWAHSCNRALERAGEHARIDHRSYAEQGLDLTPQVHVGAPGQDTRWDGRAVVAQRIAENEQRAHDNGEAILRDPTIALEALTYHDATFTRRSLGRWLSTHTSGSEQFQACLDAVLASDQIVQLVAQGTGELFTTRAMQKVELDMLEAAERMAGRQTHWVRPKHVAGAKRSRTLTAEQSRALEHILSTGDLKVVQGYAGAGKSYMLGAAREAWEAQGYRVLGAALAGKAAEGLQDAALIASRSLHSWEWAWDHGREALTGKDVLVIDEAGMVGSRQMGRVLARARGAGAKVVLVGDTEQLQAIEAGAPMRAIAGRVGQVEIAEIMRQKDSWQRDAVRAFRDGWAEKALVAFMQHECVWQHRTRETALAAMVHAWDAHRRARPQDSQIMLAYRRADVRHLNQEARALRRAAGELGGDVRVQTDRGARDFAAGDRIYFLKNDHHLEVKNGTLGTIQSITAGELTAVLDDGRQVTVDLTQYNHLDHGYAATVHKAQGVTVDRCHVYAERLFDRHVAYTAMSRHRSQVELHFSLKEFAGTKELVETFLREGRKKLAIEYREVERSNIELQKDIEICRAELIGTPEDRQLEEYQDKLERGEIDIREELKLSLSRRAPSPPLQPAHEPQLMPDVPAQSFDRRALLERVAKTQKQQPQREAERPAGAGAPSPAPEREPQQAAERVPDDEGRLSFEDIKRMQREIAERDRREAEARKAHERSSRGQTKRQEAPKRPVVAPQDRSDRPGIAPRAQEGPGVPARSPEASRAPKRPMTDEEIIRAFGNALAVANREPLTLEGAARRQAPDAFARVERAQGFHERMVEQVRRFEAAGGKRRKAPKVKIGDAGVKTIYQAVDYYEQRTAAARQALSERFKSPAAYKRVKAAVARDAAEIAAAKKVVDAHVNDYLGALKRQAEVQRRLDSEKGKARDGGLELQLGRGKGRGGFER